MQIISNEKIEGSFETFCQHMGMNADKWLSTVEFAHFISFSVLNVARHDVRLEDEILLTDDAARLIHLLHGPHAGTVVRAYMHKRFSFMGKVRATCVLPVIVISFFIVILVAIVKEFWDGW